MVAEPLQELFELVASGELRIVEGEVYGLSEVRRAHEDMQARKTSGKLVLDAMPRTQLRRLSPRAPGSPAPGSALGPEPRHPHEVAYRAVRAVLLPLLDDPPRADRPDPRQPPQLGDARAR